MLPHLKTQPIQTVLAWLLGFVLGCLGTTAVSFAQMSDRLGHERLAAGLPSVARPYAEQGEPDVASLYQSMSLETQPLRHVCLRSKDACQASCKESLQPASELRLCQARCRANASDCLDQVEEQVERSLQRQQQTLQALRRAPATAPERTAAGLAAGSAVLAAPASLAPAADPLPAAPEAKNKPTYCSRGTIATLLRPYRDRVLSGLREQLLNTLSASSKSGDPDDWEQALRRHSAMARMLREQATTGERPSPSSPNRWDNGQSIPLDYAFDRNNASQALRGYISNQWQAETYRRLLGLSNDSCW